jgi:hydroxymethylglutaryl-CoA synthase
MAYKAHRHLVCTLNPGLSEKDANSLFDASYETKVKPALWGAKEVGNIYTGSAYMNLISLMEEKADDLEGKVVGIFSYGSGCGAEYFPLFIGHGAQRKFENLRFREQIQKRRKITIEEYNEIYSKKNGEKALRPEEIAENRNGFSRYFFWGIENDKRVYSRG